MGMPFRKPSPSTEPLPAPAVVSDDVTARSLLRLTTERGWPDDVVRRGGPADAAALLAHARTPPLLVVDLADSADPAADLGALAEVCDPGTRVIALGTVNDVNLYRTLRDMGVEDYLLKPVIADALAAALDRPRAAPTPDDGDGAENDSRLVAVVGARGGVGATTLAVNLAWMLANDHRRRTALVDLDLYFGTTALALDLEPGRGFREALETPNRIDGLFIERAAVRVGERLFVLDTEEDMSRAIRPDPDAVDLLLEKMRQSFERVVVDLPRAALAGGGVAGAASDLVLVGDLSLAGMRDMLRLREYLAKAAPDSRLHLVVNRVGLLGRGEMPRSAFEKGVETRIDLAVPFDVATFMESANQGKAAPEIARKSKAVAALAELARRVDPVSVDTTAPSLLSRLRARKVA